MKYAILSNPGHNRVYFEQSINLSIAELTVMSQRFSTACSDVTAQNICGVRYIVLSAEHRLCENELAAISQLSFCYAIFEISIQNEAFLLCPVEKSSHSFMAQDISSRLKYPGKTNEIFTKLMINVALASSDFADEARISLLDPVAGKGTTLLEGLVSGYDVSAIELYDKAVHEFNIYFKKYLEQEAYKHVFNKSKVASNNKDLATDIFQYEIAKDKNALKDQNAVRHLSFVQGNAQSADKYFKKNSFHIIVGDLPYGIAHGNAGVAPSPSKTRNPAELVKLCLPALKTVLKPGGTIVLAWNAFLINRQKLAEIFIDNGMTVLTDYPYDSFLHKVDASIKRDIIVAKKT